MNKYLSLLLLGSMVQFATVDAGCKSGCNKDKNKVVKHPRGCKDKPKKGK